jgi:hypothetical protein
MSVQPSMKGGTMRKAITGLLGAALLILFAMPAQAANVTTETQDIFGQGFSGQVVSEDGATLQRSGAGVNARFTMPTPESGTYLYPPGNEFQPNGAVPGHPEAFSFWAFVFNNPDRCTDPCDFDDLGPTPAQGGVYNVAGHVVGGDTLELSGRISVGQEPFGGVALSQPMTAFVHLAVAPHGVLDPAIMPTQITKPIGSPSYWWIALFE